MKVLFLTPHYLDTAGGGTFATLANLHAFSCIVNEVTALIPYRGKEPLLQMPSNVQLINIEDHRSLFRKGIGILCGYSHRYAHIDEMVDLKSYDLVVFDTSMTSARLVKKFNLMGIKTITIHHNYQWEYTRDNVKLPLKPITLYWCAKYERESIKYSFLNLTLTEEDMYLLQSHFGKGNEKFSVLGTFEYEKKTHSVTPAVKEDVFVITGSLNSVQTEKSLIPWIREYYPLLKEAFPKVNLILAGKSPSPQLCQLAQEYGIIVIPSPKSMDDVLKQAKYYICATSLGGGLKLRVMDGLKAGLPVISHQVSARGYRHFVDSKMLFVYNDIASFKQSLNQLLECTYRKADIIKEYEKVFSFESGVVRLGSILKEYFPELFKEIKDE